MIDPEVLLTPIPGENPAGENLRYDPVYDAIQEARRADDLLDQGDWQHEVKSSDWDQVRSLAVEALSTRTKDLQVAVWLTEALTHLHGFQGLHQGLRLLWGLMHNFWDHLYPEIEDDDLDFRVGPLEFFNDKIWLPVKQIPLTDPAARVGYSWINWQESRQIGYEADAVDSKKREALDAGVADGKPTADEFDLAVKATSKQFYKNLINEVEPCITGFNELDALVDEKFGKEAPKLSDIKTALEECSLLISRILKEKLELEPDEELSPQGAGEDNTLEDNAHDQTADHDNGAQNTAAQTVATAAARTRPDLSKGSIQPVNRLLGGAGIEEAVWKNALEQLRNEGIKSALEQLLAASCSAQSVREKTNFRLLMARLCLKAHRADLARPIVEELNTLIETLQLQQWESPIWLAQALGTLHECLTAEGASDDDKYRAQELLTKLCTLDVVKALECSARL